MRSDDVCMTDCDNACRGGISAVIVALALMLTACGSEAENTNTTGTSGQQATADTGKNQSADQSAASGANNKSAGTESESAAGSEKTNMADAGHATQSDPGGESGAQESAKKEEEQKREPMDGYTVYNRFCQICHKQGMNAAPRFRDKKAWAPRIAKGKETLYKHSIEGFKGMPPKGGIAGLYDQEVKDAVDFMVKNAGGWDSASKE